MIPKNMKIFPLKIGIKEPKYVGWQKSAEIWTDKELPWYDYGMILDDQYMVIDFDYDHPERAAIEESLPRTWCQKTGRKNATGMHYLYKIPVGYKGAFGYIETPDGTHIGEVKFRGFIVGPGSIIKGNLYELLDGIEPVDMPPLGTWYVKGKKKNTQDEPITKCEGIPKGQHDKFIFSLHGFARDSWGLDEEALFRLEREGPLAVLQDTDPNNPYTEADARRHAHQAASYATRNEISVLGENIVRGISYNVPILDWYIHGFVLKGGHLMTGYAPGGTGKSSFGHFLAARVTLGGDNFLLLNHEDSPEYWKACAGVSGADPDRMFHHTHPLSLKICTESVVTLEKIIDMHDIKFIWFDSLKNHMITTKDGGDAQVQASNSLSHLSELATRTGCMIFGVFHTNKKGLPGGSTAFLDVARHVLEFKRKKNEPLLIRVEKSNVFTPDHALKMVGELKPIINPKDANMCLREKLENGKIVTRKTWITTAYIKDSDALRQLEEEKEELARREKAFELCKTMTQTEAAKVMGISQPTLSRLLKGSKEQVSIGELSD